MNLLDEFDVREVCPTCKVIILPRSRHCNICKVCVDRFDHHCQWLNNCVGSRNHGYFLVFVLTQAAYLILVTSAIIISYVDQSHVRDETDEEYAMWSTCGTAVEHYADLCFVTQFDLLTDRGQRIVTHIFVAIVLLLAGGFTFPVLQLFHLHLKNFLTGQTSIERLGKQQGKKVELTTLFNVNEPLLDNPDMQAKDGKTSAYGAKAANLPLVETRFLYREMVIDAVKTNRWRGSGIDMLPVDPSYSTCHNCSVMCCQHQSLDQAVIRHRAKEAHHRIFLKTTSERDG